MDDPTAQRHESVPARRCVLTVWLPRPGEFSARVVLDDGSVLDFDSPFELVRFLSSLAPAPGPVAGLR